MKLSQAMRFSKIPRLAIVGSGGKTSALSTLAQELPKPLVISSTTHLGTWETGFCDQHFTIHKDTDWDFIEEKIKYSGINIITQNPQKDRLPGLSIDIINRIYDLCEKHQLPLLMECDGSRQLPLKAPKENEPPIPEFVDTVVVVAGLSGLGKPLNKDSVYNPDLFSSLGNLTLGGQISISNLEQVIAHNLGGLKNIPRNAKKVLLLNQADTPDLQIQAGKIARNLIYCFNGVIITELMRNKIHALIEPSAAIILAAGSSSRYGKSKQLLDYHGVPFITAVTRSAIYAGLSPIVVVTGSDATAVKNALSEYSNEVKVIYNPNWQIGQSTSIKVGIDALSDNKFIHVNEVNLGNMIHNPGSVIFMLADQPQVTSSVLRGLLEEHSRTLAPVIAPLVDGQRGNPILFDKITFPDLKNLEGDIGGRGIFAKYSPGYIKWNDNSLLHDVDHPTDYEKLVNE